MLNKKLNKFLVLGLTTLLLTSCGEVIAKPNGADDSFINISELDEDHRDRIFNTIYDAMHDSSTLSNTTIKLVNEKLYNHYFGPYAELKEVANKYIAGDTDGINAFIDKYEAYQVKDDDKTNYDLSIARVVRSYKRIQKIISEKLTNSLTGSDYKDINGLFSEKLFALNIYKKLHCLDPNKEHVLWSDFTANYSFYEPILLLPNVELYDEDTNTWNDLGIIHINETLNYYGEYIEKDILPDVYSHMLSEFYLYTQEYSSLGSKYARKASYISLTPNTKDIYSTKHSDLINTFASKNILAGTKDTADLKILEKAWIGYITAEDTSATTLLDAAGFVKADPIKVSELNQLTEENKAAFIEDYSEILTKDASNEYTLSYYEGTLFGNIIEGFMEIKPDDIANSSKTQENKFSGNNSYSYYDGLVKEIYTLLQKSYVVDDWGLKSDGFSGLDSSIKERLMTINVATELLDYSNLTDEQVNALGLSYLKFVKYDGAEKGGNFYLLPEKTLPDNETPFVFSSGSTKTIVQVEEAASVAKLSKKGTSSTRYTAEEAEEIAFEICNLLADNSTTKSNAMEYFLEDAKILYHDDKILEYFKDNYPNLFED